MFPELLFIGILLMFPESMGMEPELLSVGMEPITQHIMQIVRKKRGEISFEADGRCL
jgi:hypothetical protein